MIPRSLLEQVCRHAPEQVQPWQAFAACRRLGRLARWWLPPEVLRRAGEHDPSYPDLTAPEPPPLSGQPRSCWVAFVRQDGTLPLLREAFLVPLRWRDGRDHAPCLPEELRLLADQVVSQVGGGQRWGLWPAEELGLDEAPAPGPLGLPCASGWAALAAGLLLARKGLLPRTGVWASGAWGPDGLQEVGDLPVKLCLAREWRARWFFVPTWQMHQARASLPETPGAAEIEIGGLEATSAHKPEETLRAYLYRLSGEPAVPPPDDNGTQFDICKAYHQLLPFRQESARAFYWTHLLPTIIRCCRTHLVGTRELTHLVTIASDSYELIPLAARMFRVRRVLILHTPDYAREIESAHRALQPVDEDGEAITVVPGEFAFPGEAVRSAHEERGGGGFLLRNQMAREVCGHIQEFLAGVPQEQAVLDLTPGNKLMTLTLERLARNEFPGSWLLYLLHQTPNGRPEPGKEFPLLWRAAES
jgi:hypothetical protein